MLAVDFLEFLDRVFGLFLRVQVVGAFVVQAIGRFVRRQLVLLEQAIEAGTAAEPDGEREQCRGHRGTHSSAQRRFVPAPPAPPLHWPPPAGLDKKPGFAKRLGRHSARIKAAPLTRYAGLVPGIYISRASRYKDVDAQDR